MWAVVLSAIVVGMASCNNKKPQMTQTSFETIVVDTSDIEVPVKFSCKLSGEDDATISPRISGQLLKKCVIEGQTVRKGQVLFEIDSRDARLELESAEANLQSALAEENSAKLEYESNKNLFEKNIVSRYMLESAENSYKQAQATVAQKRAAVNSAKVNLSYCTITAPVNGVIGEIEVNVGDQLSVGTKLTVVSGNNTMRAEFSLPESILERSLSEGVNIRSKKILDNLPDVSFIMKNGTEYQYKGRITSATGVVNATTGTFACKANFPNPERQLYSGIQGNVIMPTTRKGVMVIPQDAVVKLQDRQLVYKVLPDSTASSVTVTTEDVGNGKDFIVTGLEVGDRIVTIGANNVHEGQKVLFPTAPAVQGKK